MKRRIIVLMSLALAVIGCCSALEAQRIAPAVVQVSDSAYHNDYPSIAVDKTGDTWVAWIAYHNQGDRVLLRRRHAGVWSEPINISDKPGDNFSTTLAVDGKGRVWVVWPERSGVNWSLKARCFDGNSLSPIERLTSGKGTNIYPRLTSDHSGNLHVVWQSYKDGRFDIYLRSLIGDKWSKEINLSDPKKGAGINDWCPSVVADRNGKVWVAWDSYDTGSYNIRLRCVENGKPDKVVRVTDTPRFHDCAGLAVDDQNRLWVAWEEAEENWGKDTGAQFSGGAGLYNSRKLRVAIFDNGRWLEPSEDLNEKLTGDTSKYVAFPQLLNDAKGRMWVVFRPRTAGIVWVDAKPFGYWTLPKWEVMASCYLGSQWSAPVTMTTSAGRNEGPFDAAANPRGGLDIVWNIDHRWLIEPRSIEGNNDVMAGEVSALGSAPAILRARQAEPPCKDTMEPKERQQIATVRDYTYRLNGKTYRIYRGDTHRHTELSADGVADGSELNAYRYFLDAAGMDFGVTTDHVQSRGTITMDYTTPDSDSPKYWEAQWWRNCKMADAFNTPGHFTSLFGYERGTFPPNGHHNVLSDHRNVVPFPPTQPELVVPSFAIESQQRDAPSSQPKADERYGARVGPILYPYLHKNRNLSIVHTSATREHGADWGSYDGEVEPLVEIFQGCRVSSEGPGAPLAPGSGTPEQPITGKGYLQNGWLWSAYARGHKLGIIASSDHGSTHCSYACILSEDGSRKGLMDAMRKRHTYGATTNIIMDFRTKDSIGEHLMGDITSSSTVPELLMKIIGTGPIKEVVIIRDGKYIDRRPGTGAEMQFTFKEPSLSPGEHYYYVRMEQADHNVAWSSPIWVKMGN